MPAGRAGGSLHVLLDSSFPGLLREGQRSGVTRLVGLRRSLAKLWRGRLGPRVRALRHLPVMPFVRLPASELTAARR